MSNNGNSGLPAILAARQYRGIIDDALTGIGAGRGPHLSIRAGRFTLVDGTGNRHLVDGHTINIIIVDANKHESRVFFENKNPTQADLDSGSPPICFSDNGVGPSTQSTAPQSPLCVACPNNKRGQTTTFTGKPTTFCDRRRKLAFVLPDDPSVTVYEMQIPPASLTGLRAYGDWTRQQASGVADRKMDLNDFVTEVSFDPNKQFVLQFRAVGFADDPTTVQLLQYIYENKLSDVAVGRNDVAHDPENVKRLLSGSPQAPAIAAPAPQATSTQQFQLPPRQGQAAPEAQAPSRGRGRPRTIAPAPSAGLRAPFTPQVAPAAPQSAPPTLPPVQDDGGIPAFLQRAPQAPANPAGAPPAPPPQRFGVGAAPPPPAGLSEALSKAMTLPTRR